MRPGGNPEDLMRERNVTGRSTIAPFFMPAPLPAPAFPFGSFLPSALAALVLALYAALSGEAAGSGSVGNTDGPEPSAVSTRPSLGGCTRTLRPASHSEPLSDPLSLMPPAPT